jgi:hypothetical protein
LSIVQHLHHEYIPLSRPLILLLLPKPSFHLQFQYQIHESFVSSKLKGNHQFGDGSHSTIQIFSPNSDTNFETQDLTFWSSGKCMYLCLGIPQLRRKPTHSYSGTSNLNNQAADSSKSSAIAYEITRCKNREGHNLYPKITYFFCLSKKVSNYIPESFETGCFIHRTLYLFIFRCIYKLINFSFINILQYTSLKMDCRIHS